MSVNHAMLGQMADSSRSDDLKEAAQTPSDPGEDAPAGEQAGSAVARADTTMGERVPESSQRRPSLGLLADLERRVRRLEARVDGLDDAGGKSRRGVKASDLIRWGLLLAVIAFLAYYWQRMGALR
jgi:hypothetical protein